MLPVYLSAFLISLINVCQIHTPQVLAVLVACVGMMESANAFAPGALLPLRASSRQRAVTLTMQKEPINKARQAAISLVLSPLLSVF